MTNKQIEAMRTAIVLGATELNASKKVLEFIEQTFIDAKPTTKSGEPLREKNILGPNGDEYTWCSKHEVYEVSTNFKDNKQVSCKAATKEWLKRAAVVKKHNDLLITMATAGEDVSEQVKLLNDAKDFRTATYSFEQTSLDYSDIPNYDYDWENTIAE